MLTQQVDHDVAIWRVVGVVAFTRWLMNKRPVIADGYGGSIGLLPPAETDNLVVGRPIGKSVLSRMKYVDAAAIAHEFLKSDLHVSRPLRAAMDVIVVLNNHVVGLEPRSPRVPSRRGRTGWRGRDVHSEQARGFEQGAYELRCKLPVVVAVAVYDQHPDFVVGRIRRPGPAGHSKQGAEHQSE